MAKHGNMSITHPREDFGATVIEQGHVLCVLGPQMAYNGLLSTKAYDRDLLQKLRDAIKEKRRWSLLSKGVLLLVDNGSTHRAAENVTSNRCCDLEP